MRAAFGRQTNGAKRRRSDSGSALTEFVIVTPIFIILIFWSEFFTDLGILTLKAEEAARYANWETTAQRSASDIANEVQARFSTLNSPQIYIGSAPSTRSFRQGVNIQTTPAQPVDTPLDGHLPPFPLSGGGGGLLGPLLSGIEQQLFNGVLSSVTNSLVKRMGFNTKREMQTTVTFSAVNTLFPTGEILHLFLDASTDIGNPAVNIRVQRTSPLMLVDTWKAWPGPYGQNGGSTETDVADTYNNGGPNAVEQEIADRMKKVAFFNFTQNAVFNAVDWLMNAVGMAAPFSTNSWKDRSQAGPVIALPGATAKHGFAPGENVPTQRFGDDTNISDTPVTFAGSYENSPVAGVDRPRFTIPSQINSVFWSGVGGMNSYVGSSSKVTQFTPNINTSNVNPYPTLYSCRDAYYMGAATAQNPRWSGGGYVDNYFKQGFPLCP